MDATSSSQASLPIGTHLVHIGPSKTGTTGLQGSLWVARRDLESQGTRYIGIARHTGLAGRAASGMRNPSSDDAAPPPTWIWRGVVREMHRARRGRTVFSSEYLAHADARAAHEIVRDVDPSRIHVLITLRPIARLLPSLWQQRLLTGTTRTFQAWLEVRLGREGPLPDQAMWVSHRHGALVTRWAAAAGRDRVTVVVVDPADRGSMLRSVERLLDLQPGTLRVQDAYQNRSFTAPEALALRTLNQQLHELGVPRRQAFALVHDGAGRFLRTRRPPPDEPRTALPGWAAHRAAALAVESVDEIRASGVRVIGDLDHLLAPPELVSDEPLDRCPVPASVAAAMALGVAHPAGLLLNARGPTHDRMEEIAELGWLGYRDLAGIAVRRTKRQASRGIRTLLGLGS
jgi:hypothetical protein